MHREKSGPAYQIITSRLLLRCWDPSDAAALKKAIDENLDHLRPWMPWAHNEPEDLQRKVERIRSYRSKFDSDQEFYYGVFDHGDRHVLGACGLHTRLGEGALEIGYWIHRDHLNKGLATEVAGALVRVAFEVHAVRRVEIHCDPENTSSAAIPRKLGFTHEATLRQRRPFLDDKMRDSMIWSLFREDYPESKAIETEIEALDAAGQRLLQTRAGS